MTPAPSISVVLATYNGERYLPEFLASLAAQTQRPGRIVLRDDGSSDGSVDCVERWAAAEGIALQRVGGPRLGPARSFLAALRASPPADVHFLADQDDVWLPTKLQRGAEALAAAAPGQPTLYATRLQVVDAALQPLRLSDTPRRLSFPSAACESLLTGCTMALNEPLRRLVSRAEPQTPAMHDWWLYLVAAAAGQVIFDPTPTVLYRQHGANVVGIGSRGVALLRERWRRFAAAGDAPTRSRQLRELRALYADVMSPSALRLSGALLAARDDAWTRVRVALSAPIVRQRWHDALSTRVAILANRF